MNQLIWFSIPGGFLALAAALIWPEEIHKYDSALVLGAALGAGFVLQQFTRTLFEGLRGYKCKKWRRVLREIAGAYSIDKNRAMPPHLVWEMVLYSDDIPESFREHNRSMWHYIMSFLATALVSLIVGLCFLFGAPHCWLKKSYPAWEWGFFMAMALLFLVKAWLTYRSLEEQESACFHLYRLQFDNAYQSLSGIVR